MEKLIHKKTECDCSAIHIDNMEKAVNVLNKLNCISTMSTFFKNFADETRLKILVILDRIDKMCVCDIAVSLNMTKSAISHQLRTLKECDLVRAIKVGKEVFYTLADDHVKEIIEMGIEHIGEDK